AAKSDKGRPQDRVDRDDPSASLLRDAVPQLDRAADLTRGRQHHLPSQPGDLAGPQPGFERQQHDGAISEWIPISASQSQQPADVAFVDDFCLLAGHLTAETENKKSVDNYNEYNVSCQLV